MTRLPPRSTRSDTLFPYTTLFRSELATSLSTNVLTIAMAGSFGRLEGSALSDADYILVVKNRSARATKKDRDLLRQTIRDLGAHLPNKGDRKSTRLNSSH